MIAKIARYILPGLALLAFAAVSPGFVYETDLELLVSGDFDGDGRMDTAIVDRETGAYRLGYQAADTNIVWSLSRASGIEDVEAVAVGALLSTNADAIAFAAAAANRVNIFDASDRNTSGVPVSVFASGIGPGSAVAIDIVGPSNTVHDDLLVQTRLNGIAQYVMHTLRADGTNFAELSSWSTNDLWSRANAVTIKNGNPEVVAVIEEAGTPALVLQDLSLGAIAEITRTALPAKSDYAVGRFAGSAYSQFLVYQPGQTDFEVRPIEEPVAGTFVFGASTTVDLAVAISQLIVVEDTTTNHLMVIFDDGSASLFEFDGSSAPTLIQNETPSTGLVFTAAIPIGSSAFVLLEAGAGDISRTGTVYTFDGSLFTARTPLALAGLTDSAGRANALLFEEEPFVSFDPKKVSSLRVGDWTDLISFVGAPTNVQVDYETDAGLVTGLVAVGAADMGKAPARAQFGLASQAGTAFSVFSFEPAMGEEVSEVSISPLPGNYPGAVEITFTNQPTMPVYYRTDPAGSWSTYSTPFYLFTNVTIHYYASPSGTNNKSRIQSATYTFDSGPSTLDADGDGVPDYVESYLGLSPSGSGLDGDGDGLLDMEEIIAGTDPTDADTDGDSYSDLTELRGGSDPNNPGDTPTLPITNDVSRLELDSVFDLVLTPRPYDGVAASNVTLCLTGSALRAYSPGGSFVGYGPVVSQSIAGVTITNPAGLLADLEIDIGLGLVIATTEEHFDIETTHTNSAIGREIVGIYEAPTGAAFVVDYTYSYGDLGTEASNWISEARATYSNATAVVCVEDLGVYDCLAAVLFEKKIRDILYDRGVVTGAVISLFPFRDGDLGLEQPSFQQIKAIGTGEPDIRAYNVYSMFTNIREQVAAAASADIVALRDLAIEVYRISSAFNDDSPGTYDLPVDVLRELLSSGEMDSAYTNKTLLDTNDVSSAVTGAAAILASMSERPTATYTLEVRTNSFSDGITTLWTTSGGVAKNLYDAQGESFWFPDVFELIAGTELEVTGYTDIEGSGGSGDPVEVISITLTAIPAPSRSDADGNLLPDIWERLVFGTTGNDGDADSDGDGYSDLQEYLDGTDPLDEVSCSGAIVDLSAPEITVIMLGTTNVYLAWPWPEDYQVEFNFSVQSAETPAVAFTNVSATITGITNNMSGDVPVGADETRRFYRLIYSLEE